MSDYTFTHDKETAKTLLKGCARPRWASMIEHVNTDIDGHWIYVHQGYAVDGERGSHTIHEDTVAEALAMLPCVQQCMEDCPVCGAHYWDKTETLTCPQCNPVKADAPSDPIPAPCRFTNPQSHESHPMPFPCQSCASVTINGIPCHESGCPDAWRDRENQCRQCGNDFLPEEHHQSMCADCRDEIDHPTHDMQVCTDCLMVIANCDESGIDDEERLQAVRAGVDRISKDGYPIAGNSLGFSWHGCDCCGSHLGGDSHAVFIHAHNHTKA